MSTSQVKNGCATRRMKAKGAFAKSTLSRVGVIHFLQLTFKTLNGDVYIPLVDMLTALTYLDGGAVRSIADYCSQYGAAAPTVSTDMIAYPMDLSGNPGGNTFDDAQLQALVNKVIQEKGLTPDDALIILCPQGVENVDVPLSEGVLGYHGAAVGPYAFVNVLGTGFTVDDAAGLYALALSHEIAEMIVDPAADGSKPEVCDPCAGNCAVDYRNYFDGSGKWLGGSPVPGYAFFIGGIVTPSSVSSCPAPQGSCSYDAAYPPPAPMGCLDLIKEGVTKMESGDELDGLELIVAGLECYVTGGGGQETVRQKVAYEFERTKARIDNLTHRLEKVAARL